MILSTRVGMIVLLEILFRRHKRFARLSKPANLTHVLLSLVFHHSATDVQGIFR